MPKRQSARRIDSEEIQGDDSYIEIRFPKVKVMRTYREQMTELSKTMEELQKVSIKDRNTTAILGLSTQVELLGDELINAHLKAWNWVDDDENPLPQPYEDDVLDMLETNERTWILQQFQISASEKKE